MFWSVPSAVRTLILFELLYVIYVRRCSSLSAGMKTLKKIRIVCLPQNNIIIFFHNNFHTCCRLLLQRADARLFVLFLHGSTTHDASALHSQHMLHKMASKPPRPKNNNNNNNNKSTAIKKNNASYRHKKLIITQPSDAVAGQRTTPPLVAKQAAKESSAK